MIYNVCYSLRSVYKSACPWSVSCYHYKLQWLAEVDKSCWYKGNNRWPEIKETPWKCCFISLKLMWLLSTQLHVQMLVQSTINGPRLLRTILKKVGKKTEASLRYTYTNDMPNSSGNGYTMTRENARRGPSNGQSFHGRMWSRSWNFVASYWVFVTGWRLDPKFHAAHTSLLSQTFDCG